MWGACSITSPPHCSILVIKMEQLGDSRRTTPLTWLSKPTRASTQLEKAGTFQAASIFI